MTLAPIFFIGPWTFLYGILFSGVALGLSKFVKGLGWGFLGASFLYLQDIPGSLLAVSLFILWRVSR